MTSPSVDLKLEGPFNPTDIKGELFAPGLNPVDVVVSATGVSGPVDLAKIALPEAPFAVTIKLTGSGEDQIVVTNASHAGERGTRIKYGQLTFAGADASIRRAMQRSVEVMDVTVGGREFARVKCPIESGCEIRFEFSP